MNHSFDIDHAKKYGLPEAIILQNIIFWLAHNKAFGKNIKDGKPWTFNSVTAYAKLFPYWTKDKIRRYIESLEKQGVLVSGNYNEKGYDRTKWHTLADQSLIPVTDEPVADSPNGTGENAQPIPDINTLKKQRSAKADNQSKAGSVNLMLTMIEKKTGQNLYDDKKLQGYMYNRLRVMAIEHLLTALNNYLTDKFYQEKRAWNFQKFFNNQTEVERFRTMKQAIKPAKVYMEPNSGKEYFSDEY